MRVHTILGALAAAATFFTAGAIPMAQPAASLSDAEILDKIEKRAATIAVTGVVGGSAQPRLELRVMQQQHPDLFNLYLLGLQSFMAVDQSDPLSYYQIAGPSCQLLLLKSH